MLARRAGEETRTLDIQLGKLALYQLSYARRWLPLQSTHQHTSKATGRPHLAEYFKSGNSCRESVQLCRPPTPREDTALPADQAARRQSTAGRPSRQVVVATILRAIEQLARRSLHWYPDTGKAPCHGSSRPCCSQRHPVAAAINCAAGEGRSPSSQYSTHRHVKNR